MLRLFKHMWFKKHPDAKLYVEVPHSQIQGRALAHVNWGRWIAHCPRVDCKSASALDPHQGVFCCQDCLAVALVVWPDNADEIWDELERRPVRRTRNWFPAGHPWAEAAGQPTGQTVQDLADEFAEHAQEVA
jgi:hypothetical protein